MTGRTAARLVAAGLLGLSIAGAAHASRFGGSGGRGGGGHFVPGGHFGGGGGHFVPGGNFGGGHFHHGFHTRVFIGGAFFAPFYFPPPAYYYYPPAYYPPAYYPPAYYPPEYAAPAAAPAPASSYWYYCPGANAYYPYVRECPGGWQQVAPQPPSQ